MMASGTMTGADVLVEIDLALSPDRADKFTEDDCQRALIALHSARHCIASQMVDMDRSMSGADKLVNYEALVGWLKQAPMTWLPALFHEISELCHSKHVFAKECGDESDGPCEWTSWNDMSTAPRDELILGWIPTRYQGQGSCEAVMWHEDGWYSQYAAKEEPSHWRRLPGGPNSVNEEHVAQKMVEHAMQIMKQQPNPGT